MTIPKMFNEGARITVQTGKGEGVRNLPVRTADLTKLSTQGKPETAPLECLARI